MWKSSPTFSGVELKHFFENYKTLENKKVVVDEFQSKSKAIEIINESLRFSQQEFRK